MSIQPELEAKILRYYHVEKWRVGTIARQLQVHHGTVQRVLRRAGVPTPQHAARASKADPYLPFIRQTLERFPTLTASRVYAMVRERGADLRRSLPIVSSWRVIDHRFGLSAFTGLRSPLWTGRSGSTPEPRTGSR